MFATLPLFYVLLAQVSTPPASQLRGTIKDEQGAAIVGAHVAAQCGRTARQATTNSSGEFSIAGLTAARCRVTVTADLFDTARKTVELSKDGGRTDFTLPVRGLASNVIVSATRGIEESTFRVPEATSVITHEQMQSRPYRILPLALREEPGVLVQQTTSAQGSPIIRGFTGQSNVYLIDGVRFNTSVWRSGPSQYLAWLGGSVVDRMEIVRGPGSVQSGSDALGGTINLRTAKPAFLADGARGVQLGGAVDGVLGSGDGSAGGNLDIVLRTSRAAFRFGGGAEQVKNLRPGGGIDSHATVTRFLGLPSISFGDELPDTGYKTSGGYLIGQVRVSRAATLSTVFMHTSQTGASRYDRVSGGDGLYKSGFSPQRLDFGLLRYEQRGLLGFDTVSAGFSVNRQDDGRFEQTRPTAVLDAQAATTTAYGYQVEAQRAFGSRHQLSVGSEYYDEGINASRTQTNPTTGVVSVQRPDVPGGTTYSSLGVFAQDVTELIPGRLSVKGGVRYGRFDFSTIADTIMNVPAQSVTTDALTFNAGAVVSLTSNLNLVASVNRGFRAPNSADLGAIGLTGGGGFEIAPSQASALGGFVGTTGAADAVSTGTPIPALGPEVVYSYEGGLKFSSKRLSASLAVYDVEYHNAIVRRSIVFPTNIVGQTIAGFLITKMDPSGVAYIAQDARPVATRVNVDHARLVGVDAEAHVRIAEPLTAMAYVSMTNGHLVATGEYLRRMPPPLGGARVRWTDSRNRGWVEGAMSFARAQTRFNAGDITDARIGGNRTRTQIASYFNGTATDLGLVKNGVLVSTNETLAQVQTRILGTATQGALFTSAPGFVTFGLRGGWNINAHLGLTVIGENLTDKNYRLYGSGVDAAGRNVQLRARVQF